MYLFNTAVGLMRPLKNVFKQSKKNIYIFVPELMCTICLVSVTNKYI